MVVMRLKAERWLNAQLGNRGKYRALCSLHLSHIILSEWGHLSINIRQQDRPVKGFMYCVIKCIARGNQARVKNADLRHPSAMC